MLISRMVQGEEVEVPVEECWDSICKILRLARLLTRPESNEHRNARTAFLAERLCDLEGLSFHHKRRQYACNIAENFVPDSKDFE